MRCHVVYQAEKFGVVRLDRTSQVYFLEFPPTAEDVSAVENAIKNSEKLDDVKLLYWTPLTESIPPESESTDVADTMVEEPIE